MANSSVAAATDNGMINTEPKISFLKKMGYGMGDFGSQYSWYFVSSFALIYFTNIVGLDPAVIGVLILLGRVLDGVTDLIMGMIVDRTKFKSGKTRMWQLIGAVPMAILTFLTFNIPATLGQTGQYLWVFTSYVLLGAVFYTMVNVAYGSMVGFVTTKKKDRVSLGAFRFIFAVLGAITLGALTMGIVKAFGGGQVGWFYTSIIFSGIAFVCMILPVLSLKELPAHVVLNLSEDEHSKKKDDPIMVSLAAAFKNRHFVLTLIRNLLVAIVPGIMAAAAVYYAKYVLNSEASLGLLVMVSGLPVAIAMPFLPMLSKKFSILQLGVAGSAVSALGGLLMMFAGNNLPMLLVGLFLYAIGLGPIAGTGQALNAEIAEYSALKYGKDVMGMVFGAGTIASKLGAGVSAAVLGFVLSWSGFVGTQATQPQSAIEAIRFVYTAPALVCFVLIGILFMMTTVEKENIKMRAELAAKNA